MIDLPLWVMVLFGPLIVAASGLSLILWLTTVVAVIVSIVIGVLRLKDGLRGRR